MFIYMDSLLDAGFAEGKEEDRGEIGWEADGILSSPPRGELELQSFFFLDCEEFDDWDEEDEGECGSKRGEGDESESIEGK